LARDPRTGCLNECVINAVEGGIWLAYDKALLRFGQGNIDFKGECTEGVWQLISGAGPASTERDRRMILGLCADNTLNTERSSAKFGSLFVGCSSRFTETFQTEVSPAVHPRTNLPSRGVSQCFQRLSHIAEPLNSSLVIPAVATSRITGLEP
jgi:hypothetical protein